VLPRVRRRPPGQGRAGGGVGVDEVGLADAATFGPVRAVDLDDPVPERAGGAAESGPVGGRAFPADREYLAVGVQEGQGRGVSGRGGGERGIREVAAVVADDPNPGPAGSRAGQLWDTSARM
jgi:hypothetical protein